MNAPKTGINFDVEGTIPFGANGDSVEHPCNNGNNSNNVEKSSAGSQNLVSYAHPKESSDSSVRVTRVDIFTGVDDEDHDDYNKEIEKPEEAPASRPSATTPRSIRWMIIIGVMTVLLLVGLIAGVSLALTRDNGNPSANVLDGETEGSSSGTGNPDDVPTSDTTLGRIYNEGILRCGVGIEYIGFSSTNPKTGRMEGFDADLCRAVAAGIFGPDNIDDRVEFVPISTIDRWSSLHDKKYDVLAQVSTHTMEREVMEVRWRNSSHCLLV
jgi:hypothetical protein